MFNENVSRELHESRKIRREMITFFSFCLPDPVVFGEQFQCRAGLIFAQINYTLSSSHCINWTFSFCLDNEFLFGRNLTFRQPWNPSFWFYKTLLCSRKSGILNSFANGSELKASAFIHENSIFSKRFPDHFSASTLEILNSPNLIAIKLEELHLLCQQRFRRTFSSRFTISILISSLIWFLWF